MSQEMFYTSAPKGLQPGSRGFCTVAATRGMSPALLEKLESLSGYRPFFPPHDARAALNPVTFAHVRVTVGGRVFPVLTRVGPAGLDYTERPNKFAHHVVLEVGELPAAGPAWLLSQPGFMEARWDGQVGFLPAGRTPPDGSMEADTGHAWLALTGDASQRNMLAEAFRADPSRLVYLLFEPGMDLLPLLAESLASLTPEQRWEVTFSTYFTGLPQGVQCLWRCVPHGAPEAKGARQGANALVIDLAGNLEPARGRIAAPPPLPGRELAWPDTEMMGPVAAVAQASGGPKVFVPPLPSSDIREAIHPMRGRKAWLFPVAAGAAGGMAITLGFVTVLLVLSGAKVMPWLTKNTHQEEIAEANSGRGDPVEKKVDADKMAENELLDQLDQAKRKIDGLNKQLEDEKGKREELIRQKAAAEDQRDKLVSQIGTLEKRGEESKKEVAELQQKVKDLTSVLLAARKIDFVPYNLRLTNIDKDLSIPNLPEDFSHCKLTLRGLETDIDGETKLTVSEEQAGLVVNLQHKKESYPIARFWLEKAKLHFAWKKRDGIKPSNLAQARRNIRNAVLEIKIPDSKDPPIRVGLILMREASREASGPWQFLFSKPGPHSHLLKFDEESAPLHKLFIASANCELVSDPSEIGSESNHLRLLWKNDIDLWIDDNKKLDEVYLTAKWNGQQQPPPTLRVKNFVVYMVVDGLNVEVLRAGR